LLTFKELDKRILVVGLVVLYYFIRRDAGDYYINKGIIEMTYLAFIPWLMTTAILWKARYQMFHVTVDGFSGSFMGTPPMVKDHKIIYAIINTGESIDPVHVKGKLATLVIPRNQLNKVGNNLVGSTKVKKLPLHKLPRNVYRYVRDHETDFNIDNVYFGFYDRSFMHENPDLKQLEADLENIHALINEQDDLLEGKNDRLIEQMEFAKQISGKPSWIEMFRRPPRSDEEK
jgi:hypothetical protein